jgi:hypothetical protein
MPNMQRPGHLAFAILVAGAILSTAPAYAFNPEPDPPVKLKSKIDWGDKSNTYSGRVQKNFIEDPNQRKAGNTGAVGNVVSPGLLETNSGFSFQGPAGTGTPLATGAGSARPGAAGIR